MKHLTLRFVVLATTLLVGRVFGEETSSLPSEATPQSIHHRRLFVYNPKSSVPAAPDAFDAPSLSFDSQAVTPESIPFKSLTPEEWRNRAPDTPISAADLISNKVGAKVVFSMPPSTSFSYDSHYPATWYPSVSFRF